MDVLEAILGRRTIKKFTNQPVEKDDLEMALEAACRAPSHRNSQPWEFRVLKSEAIIKLSGILPVGYPLEIPDRKEREGLDKKVKWIE
jgi:nitroreductase